MPAWTSEMLNVETRTIQPPHGDPVQLLSQGTPLWHILHGVGEQVLAALDDLGYVRTDALGQQHGFKVKETAVTPDGHYGVVHLDVTDHQLFQPGGGRRAQGKPVSYVTLVSDKILEQIRIRVSEMLNTPVDCWVDNHFWVRYVFDLYALCREHPAVFPTANAVDYLEAIPGPLHIPLGLDAQGVLHWHDLHRGRHLLLTGLTGAGKTTLMATGLLTLVHATAPQDLRLAFIDGQGINFKAYRQRLAEYEFVDAEGSLPDDPDPAESPLAVVRALARLNHEHLRRLHRLAATDWDNLADYNAHAAPEDRLPYLVVFTDELGLLREQLAAHQRAALKTFDAALGGLLFGARKVGIRMILCTQYLTARFLPRAQASQAGLILAFQNSPQGSRNTLGDSEAALLREPGRFIVEGLPQGRLVLQGLYVDRETMLTHLESRGTRVIFPVDGLVQEILGFILAQLHGSLARDPIAEAFQTVLSARQVQHFIAALERVGLARPGRAGTFPPEPKQLTVPTLNAALEVLRFHPEIAFHATTEDRYVFGRDVSHGSGMTTATLNAVRKD